jgi:CopG family nickel-responsive transcriptional regulator
LAHIREQKFRLERRMNRVTIVLDDDLLAEVDRLIKKRGYQNRSEAIRDLARGGLAQAAEGAEADGPCVAALVYTYDHAKRDLPKRLVQTFHDHHDLSVSTLHVHLDHDACLEVNVLRGEAREVRHLAEHVIAERGVEHGRVVLFPSQKKNGQARGDKKHRHSHKHKTR